MKLGNRVVAVVICIVFVSGCGHWRDQGMLDAGRALVPPEASVLSESDNEGAIGLLSGDYQAYIDFDEGGLDPDALIDAVARHAAGQDWVERYRCDRPGAWIVGYSRDKYKANVWVWKSPAERDNFVRIQRMGDGNSWPPRDCSVAG